MARLRTSTSRSFSSFPHRACALPRSLRTAPFSRHSFITLLALWFLSPRIQDLAVLYITMCKYIGKFKTSTKIIIQNNLKRINHRPPRCPLVSPAFCVLLYAICQYRTENNVVSVCSLRRVTRFLTAAFLPWTLFSRAWSSAPCCLCSSKIYITSFSHHHLSTRPRWHSPPQTHSAPYPVCSPTCSPAPSRGSR